MEPSLVPPLECPDEMPHDQLAYSGLVKSADQY